MPLSFAIPIICSTRTQSCFYTKYCSCYNLECNHGQCRTVVLKLCILLVLTKNVRRKIVYAISYDYDYHNTVGVQK